jgi:hypothetical protein
MKMPPIGMRVRLVRDVERYPHFIAEAGRTGVVVDATERSLIAVKMDELLEGSDEWDNSVCWEWCGDGCPEGLPEFWQDCDPL